MYVLYIYIYIRQGMRTHRDTMLGFGVFFSPLPSNDVEFWELVFSQPLASPSLPDSFSTFPNFIADFGRG